MTEPFDHWTVARTWTYADPDSPGHRVTIHELLAIGIAEAKSILTVAGFSDRDLIEGGSGLYERVAHGSLEEIAINVLLLGKSGMTVLDAAKPRARLTLIDARLAEQDGTAERWSADWDGRNARMIDACGLTLARFGMELAILRAKAGGLADQGERGWLGQEQRRKAADAAGEAALRREWHTAANKLWTDNPTWTITRVAGAISTQFSTDRNIVAPRSVARSIKRLIPRTSPSFKEE